MTEKEKNITSWTSALTGLRILADQNKTLYKGYDELALVLQARFTEEEKKKIKESVDFISYMLRANVKKIFKLF